MAEEYVKEYVKWNTYKQTLDQKEFASLFSTREIWWCALGVNIGSEEDGKNESFERPILILKKVNGDRVLAIPITSKIANYRNRMNISLLGGESQLLFAQMRTVSTKRLLRRIQRVKTVIFQNIIISLTMYILESDEESEAPPERRGVALTKGDSSI